jgi:hypothetical protein
VLGLCVLETESLCSGKGERVIVRGLAARDDSVARSGLGAVVVRGGVKGGSVVCMKGTREKRKRFGSVRKLEKDREGDGESAGEEIKTDPREQHYPSPI